MIRTLLQFALKVRRFYWWAVRPVTQGARAILVNPEGKILLLRHTYGVGWTLPGGRVRKGEDYECAIRRELKEELGVTDISHITKLGEYRSTHEYKKDTIAVFVVRSFTLAPKRHFEVETWNAFDPRMLPDGASPGTQKRVKEWLGETTVSGQW